MWSKEVGIRGNGRKTGSIPARLGFRGRWEGTDRERIGNTTAAAKGWSLPGKQGALWEEQGPRVVHRDAGSCCSRWERRREHLEVLRVSREERPLPGPRPAAPSAAAGEGKSSLREAPGAGSWSRAAEQGRGRGTASGAGGEAGCGAGGHEGPSSRRETCD